MDKQEQILEIVQFLAQNAASKEDLRLLEKRIDTKLETVKSDILTQVDGFIQLHQKLDLELTALRDKYNRLEAQMEKVLHHLQLS